MALFRLSSASIAVCLAFASAGASADPFVAGSGISFSGEIAPAGGTTWGTATGIDFGAAFVAATSGSFTTLAAGSPATFTDFTFSPFPGAGIAPLWTAGIFSFNLASLTIESQASDVLQLRGSGTFMNNGDTALGSFLFTANQGGTTFSFSSSNTVIPVPGTVALLGLGLLGVAALRRKQSA
jgi:hypothetical protein